MKERKLERERERERANHYLGREADVPAHGIHHDSKALNVKAALPRAHRQQLRVLLITPHMIESEGLRRRVLGDEMVDVAVAKLLEDDGSSLLVIPLMPVRDLIEDRKFGTAEDLRGGFLTEFGEMDLVTPFEVFSEHGVCGVDVELTRAEEAEEEMVLRL